MQDNRFNPGLHRFAIVVALSALGLIAIGGLVTSHGVGMAVPDWPTSFGYNMFALPVSLWLTGGVFHEHTHRLWASEVGLLTLVLNCWLFGRKARGFARGLGVLIFLAGVSAVVRGTGWTAAAYFGFHGLALFGASFFWPAGEPASKAARRLGIASVVVVITQGLLGGLRVVLDAHVFAGTKLGVVFGIFHGCLGQAFFVLLCAIALMTGRWWLERFVVPPSGGSPSRVNAELRTSAPRVTLLLLFTTALIFLQLILGATMRHQHAGLAIWDFPRAHGQWWPDLSAGAIERYNATRTEVVAAEPITAAQVVLQMAHRIGAVLVLTAVAVCFVRLRRAAEAVLRRSGLIWLSLVLAQAGLGAWTVWSNKAADIATLHVVVGALTLATGALICIIAFRSKLPLLR